MSKKLIETCARRIVDNPIALNPLIKTYIDKKKDTSGQIWKIAKLASQKDSEMLEFLQLTAEYFWVFIWTKTGKFGDHYHASTVIKFSEQCYATVNHALKGQNIINFTEFFPFNLVDPKDKYWYMFDFDVIGGILCKGNVTNEMTIKIFLYNILRFWYEIDIGPDRKSSYPGSCTGVAETAAFLVNHNYFEICTPINKVKKSQKKPLLTR